MMPRLKPRMKRRATAMVLGGLTLGAMAGDTIHPWEALEAARYGNKIQSVTTNSNGSRQVTFMTGGVQIWDTQYQIAAKKAYIVKQRPDIVTKCYATGCDLYQGNTKVSISHDPDKLLDVDNGAGFVPAVENFLTNLVRPDPTPAPPVQNTGFVPFDQYKYGEMRDGQGNLIQSGPVSPGGSSFDYRYYQQSKQGAVDNAVINQYVEQKTPTLLDTLFGSKPGPSAVYQPTVPRLESEPSLLTTLFGSSPGPAAAAPMPVRATRPDPTPSAPVVSPYSSGIPSLFDSPILKQYLQLQVSRTPAKRKTGSIAAPLIVGVAVVAVGIFLLTRK